MICVFVFVFVFVISAHHHQVVVKQVFRSVPSASPSCESTSMDPHQDRQQSLFRLGGVDVEVEAILGSNHITSVIPKVILLLHLEVKIRE